MHDTFLDGIQQTKVLSVTFDSNEKGIITRTCIPYDYGPSRRYKDGKERYHFYDLDSPDGSHNLSILPEQITNIELTENTFEPSDYVKWTPNWFIKRDWGAYS